MANLDAALGTRDDDARDDGAATRAERGNARRVDARTTATRGRRGSAGGVRRAIEDWLGAGPRWDVPHGGARFAATMLAVDASFYAAGALAPLVEYAARASREGRDGASESAEALAADSRRGVRRPERVRGYSTRRGDYSDRAGRRGFWR